MAVISPRLEVRLASGGCLGDQAAAQLHVLVLERGVVQEAGNFRETEYAGYVLQVCSLHDQVGAHAVKRRMDEGGACSPFRECRAR